MTWLLLACAALGRADTPVAVEYRMISQAQTCLGNTRIRVDLDGSVRAARNTRSCPRGEIWSDPYPDTPTLTLSSWQRARLMAAIDAEDVWTHATELAESSTQDGYREELDIRLGDRTRTLLAANGTSAVIGRVRALLQGWTRAAR